MDSAERQRLRREAKDLQVALHVGKNGLGPTVVAEVDRQLAAHQLLKVRLLEGAREHDDRHALADALAAATGAAVIEVRGFTAVLYRPKKGKTRPSAPS